jgi:hypothetical protein
MVLELFQTEGLGSERSCFGFQQLDMLAGWAPFFPGEKVAGKCDCELLANG